MGSKINPIIISPSCCKAIDIAKCGIPCRKFVVPSIGSIIHIISLFLFIIFPVSSVINE